MTSIVNLFSGSNDLTKNKSITESAAEYKAKKMNLNTPTPALSQGEKFKNYQKKIKKNLEKKINAVNSKEGFQGIEQLQDGMNLNPNGLTAQSINIINNNDYSSQQQTIANLQEQYKDTLSQYENLVAQISGSTTGYLNRVNPNNPYLGKNVCLSNGACGYVTQQGVFKWYPADNNYTYNNTAGKNGCPNTPYEQINGDGDINNIGSTISSNPPLIVGNAMRAGQSCGSEGSNVYVNSMINNPTASYEGCYADNTTSPLMTFIGGAPSPPTNLVNGNFDQPQIANNSYQYITSSSTVPGWWFNAVIVNSSSAWGYPTPYPNGNQCACIQMTQSIAQTLSLQSGVQYTITFVACGRNCCDGSGQSNPINIQLYTTSNQYISTIYNFQAPVSQWTNYTTTFTVQNSGNYQIFFSGTWTAGDRSTAIQNIQLNSNGASSNGSYTYEQCQNAAVDAGYQYFSLQGVNPSTSQGYCAVSNSEPTATSLGAGMIPSGQQALWASNTASSETSNPGSTASLTNVGALTVYNSGGQSVFSSPNSNAQPSNYLGCYGDSPNRAMPLYNNGSQQYNNEQCQQIAQQNGATYYGLQNSTSGTTAQCALSNNWGQTSEYGTAGNCTQIGDGSWSGGGWSNAVYNTNVPNSNYFLILQDDGNMCVYRGTGPNDNQGTIWCSMTNGQQQQGNPNFAAAKGKYGQNWMASGSTLAAGDFIGSTNGNLALIMQSDGNLVLYTFTLVSNCQKMADGNTGGGVGANALYNIGEVGVQSDMSQLAYIDQNSQLHNYPSTNTQYSNNYSQMNSTNSAGYDIPGAAYGGATVEQCQSSCNNNPQCAGFVMSAQGNICWPKTSSMYPNGDRQIDSNSTLYIRSKTPISTPIGVPQTVNNIDTITYSNYVNGGAIGNEYGLANATSSQKQQLSQLQSQMNLLTNQINNLTGKFGSGSQQAESQSQTNVQGIQDYLQGLETTNSQIKNFSTNVERILSDSDIVVLQKNYDYLFWSILAAGTVLITMNIVKK
jgi:hypothetical protein